MRRLTLRVLRDYAFVSAEDAMRKGVFLPGSPKLQSNPAELCLLLVEDQRTGEHFTHVMGSREAWYVVRNFNRWRYGYEKEFVDAKGDGYTMHMEPEERPFPVHFDNPTMIRVGWPDEWHTD
jgi:hypothetical protein